MTLTIHVVQFDYIEHDTSMSQFWPQTGRCCYSTSLFFQVVLISTYIYIYARGVWLGKQQRSDETPSNCRLKERQVVFQNRLPTTHAGEPVSHGLRAPAASEFTFETSASLISGNHAPGGPTPSATIAGKTSTYDSRTGLPSPHAPVGNAYNFI